MSQNHPGVAADTLYQIHKQNSFSANNIPSQQKICKLRFGAIEDRELN
jgi:hypothetical protein